MLTLIEHNLVTLLVALLIGVATGWWMFRHRRRGPVVPADRPEDSPQS